ncbi:MAG TPA: site-2 protease family protein [Candidatus Saccharimonadales bacterium]|nr:site-2 protease family protein [Candidatus Saccharimonadales bacterium]
MQLSLSDLLIIVPVLFVSMAVHESMHAFTSFWLGDDTAQLQGRISLNPLRHIDPFTTLVLPVITLVLFGVPLLAAKPVPFNPLKVRFEEFGAALVGIAGPLSNAVLALIGAGILHLIGGGSDIIVRILSIFIELNVALFIFNMIPIPPLDGSRLLYAFAPEGLQEIMARLEQFGVFIIFALILVFPGFTNLLINLNQSLLKFLV